VFFLGFFAQPPLVVSPRAFRLAGRGQGVDEVGLVGLDAFTSGGAARRVLVDFPSGKR